MSRTAPMLGGEVLVRAHIVQKAVKG